MERLILSDVLIVEESLYHGVRVAEEILASGCS